MKDETITVIRAKGNPFDLKLKELMKYRELIWLLVKKNYATRYKQTILGSAWLLINPICTVVMNTIVFGAIAGLSTDGVPGPVFYLAGNIMWALFAGCLNDASGTFIGNAALFGKIYFPRLAVPAANAITQIGDFFIKFALLVALSILYAITGASRIELRAEMLLLPALLVQLALLGTGTGIIISSFTTKYRDLQVLVGFGVSIWMYLSPIVYSLKAIPERYLGWYLLNPVAPAILIFKKAFLGAGQVPWASWGISWCITLFVALFSMLIFNHIERTFMDTV